MNDSVPRGLKKIQERSRFYDETVFPVAKEVQWRTENDAIIGVWYRWKGCRYFRSYDFPCSRLARCHFCGSYMKWLGRITNYWTAHQRKAKWHLALETLINPNGDDIDVCFKCQRLLFDHFDKLYQETNAAISALERMIHERQCKISKATNSRHPRSAARYANKSG